MVTQVFTLQNVKQLEIKHFLKVCMSNMFECDLEL